MYNYIVLYCIGFSTCESDSELDYKLDNYIALYCIKISACKSVQNYLCTKVLLYFNIVLCRIKWLNCTWESDTEPDPRSIFTFPLQPFNLNIKYKVGIMRKHLYKGRLEKKNINFWAKTWIKMKIHIQGYQHRMRLQRRLYEICIVCFLTFLIPWNYKHLSFLGKSLNKSFLTVDKIQTRDCFI